MEEIKQAVEEALDRVHVPLRVTALQGMEGFLRCKNAQPLVQVLLPSTTHFLCKHLHSGSQYVFFEFHATVVVSK